MSWVQNEAAVRFGREGTMLSTGRLTFAMDKPSCTLEIWFEPDLIWARGTLLAFYDKSSPTSLALYHNHPDLVLQRGTLTQRNKGNPPRVRVKDLFRKRHILDTNV